MVSGGGDNAHERLHYALRAAELSGKPGPIYRYVEKSVVVWSLTDQPMLMERYALHLVADSFDTPFYKSRAMEEYLMGQNNMTQEELRNFGWELYGEMQAAASAAAERNRPGN